MVTNNTNGKPRKNVKTSISRDNSDKENVSEVTIEKKISNNSDSRVSVFTKTTSPKVVIQSEKIDNPDIIQKIHRLKIIKSAYFIVIAIILLMILFISLKTYNTVNELYQLLNHIN